VAQFLHPQAYGATLEEFGLFDYLYTFFQVGKTLFEHVESRNKLIELVKDKGDLLLKAHAHVIVRDELNELISGTVLQGNYF
jgi:hypothetical protein